MTRFPVLFAGTDTGHAPTVQAYDAETGALNFSKLAYEKEFTGGVRVAAADITRDTYPDLIVAPGPGGGPRLRVLDGKTGQQVPGPLGNFYAFDPTFTGGVNVSGADVNGDGYPDVIAAAGQGGGPHVKVFSGKDGAVLASFYAFEERFQGGVTVASADFTNDGKAELVVSPGPTGGPRIRILDVNRAAHEVSGSNATASNRAANEVSGLDGAATGRERSESATATKRIDPTPLRDFFAFAPDQRSGATVGTDWKAGDVTGDGTPDLLVGSGPGTAPTVRVYSGADGTLAREFPVFDPQMTAGVRVATAFVTDDPYAEVIVATGPGTTNRVQIYDGYSVAGVTDPGSTPQLITGPLADFAPFGRGFDGGVNIGASNDPPTVLLEDDYTLAAMYGQEFGTATLHVKVTADDPNYPDRFIWLYTLTNDTFFAYTESDSLYFFNLWFLNSVADAADWDTSEPDQEGFEDGSTIDGISLSETDIGHEQTAWMTFTTPELPIEFDGHAVSGVPGASIHNEHVPGPGAKPQVEFRYGATGAAVGDDGIKVAKWDGAFEVGSGLAIIGPDVNNLDFIDRDSDRFNVWVYDPTKWKELDLNNAPKNKHIQVNISTTNVDGFTDYNDLETNVDLVRYVPQGGPTGWYWSDSQILVSNSKDDGHNSASYLQTDDAAPGGDGLKSHNGVSWKVSDRTHRVALGGTVTADYEFANDRHTIASAVAKVAYYVKVHATIINGSGVAGESVVRNDIYKANEQYAQVGIQFIADVQTKAAPALVDLTDRYGILDTITNGDLNLSAEEAALLSSYRTQDNDDIEMYYVNIIERASDGLRYAGYACIAALVSFANADSVAISEWSMTNMGPRRAFIVPHELGHILTNGSHYAGDILEVNVMRKWISGY